MKYYKIITVLILFLISLMGFSQEFRERKDQLKAMKIGFITNQLALTPEEATKFWPVFNDFEAKQEQIRHQKKKLVRDQFDDDKLDNIGDKDAAAILVQMQNSEEDLHQLRKKFVISLKTILPPLKIIKLIKTEEEFKRTLLRQYKDRRRD